MVVTESAVCRSSHDVAAVMATAHEASSESAPLLAADARGTDDAIDDDATMASSTYWRGVRAGAVAPIAVKVLIATMAVGAFTSGMWRLSGNPRFFVGLPNGEGVGAMLQHLGCYADLAQATGRRLVYVPQYEDSHYTDSNRGGPVMDFGKAPLHLFLFRASLQQP